MEVLISDPFYSFLFVGAGLLFLFLEVFVPSGGILGLLSVACTAFGIYGLFDQGRTGLGALAIAVSAASTAAGVRFGLRRLSFSGSLPPETSTSVDQRIESLLGKEGITHTPLRPAGTAIIDGKKVDVMTQGHFVDQNVLVRVVATTGNWVVVREVSPDKKETPSENGTTPTA